MPGTIRIAPSILAADFCRLGEQVAEAEAAGADRIHVDVMDGHFVPNISIGLPVVRSLRRATRLPIEVHLMIEEPEQFIDAFARDGADSIIVHQETCPHLHRTIQQIRSVGKVPGVAINPSTPAAALEEVLDEVDIVLVMTVNPGFGGQGFIEGTLRKVRLVRDQLNGRGRMCEIEVDGGIDLTTAPRAVAAGASVLVAGTAIFGFPGGIRAAITGLRERAGGGQVL